MRNNSRLVPYIPKQFYYRCKELESMAYTLRHSETKYKTRIRMGISDLELHKKRPFENFWTTVQPQYYSEAVQLNLRPNSGTNFNSRKSNQE